MQKDQWGKKNAMYRHGMFGTPTHKSWDGMIQRCCNPKSKDYKNWGARGIRVCEEWRDFKNFYRDMGKKPKGLTLGRINNGLGYSKENCRWETQTEQLRNRRGCVFVTINGETKNLSAWIEHFKINQQTFSYRRYQKRWDIIKALTTPMNKQYSRR
jgi:hypothetical protein